MQTEAIFNNIGSRLKQEIKIAKKSIYIAVAWFTNKELFDELILKAQDGCDIKIIIIDDYINSGSSLNFNLNNNDNLKIYKVSPNEKILMHNKFCIIDYNTIINGSYNWSYKAENNYENIVITYNDTLLAKQFITEFNRIYNKYFTGNIEDKNTFSLDTIISRLEILKNYILLEDTEELNKEIKKLNNYKFNSDLHEIIKEVDEGNYTKSINIIEQFIQKNKQLSVWKDPELIALKLEIKNLENTLSAFDNEKIELEKLLSEFQHRHSIELGEIILEILKLRKIKYKADRTKFKEAEKDEEEYQNQFKEEQSKEFFKISDEQRNVLKKKFRKASMLCHPDKVNDEFIQDAKKIFNVLKKAYDKNDIEKVSQIYSELEKGNYLKIKSETVTEKDMLRASISKLKEQIKILTKEIILIKKSNTYQTIVNIDNWNDYFNEKKAQLQTELDQLIIDCRIIDYE